RCSASTARARVRASVSRPSASAWTRSTSPEPACSGATAANPRFDIPHSATIRRARPVALAMSLEAPWVKSPSRRISSAARPARETARRARASVPVRNEASSPPIHVTPPAAPRGTIVTWTGSWASGRGRARELAVEATGRGQGRSGHVGTVRGGDADDVAVLAEPVHLDQQGVERRLPLVGAAAARRRARAGPADGVELVEEDDPAGLLGLGEQVAHPGGADADEHLGEVGAGGGVERHAGLPGHGPGQQGLAGPRRADQQEAAGHPGAGGGEAVRLVEV